MKIRKAKEEDSEAILEMYNSSDKLGEGNCPGYVLSNVLDYMNGERNRFFVCEEDGAIVGFINSEFFSDYVYLNHLFVKKEFRSKGVASLLFDKVENEMKSEGIDFVDAFTGVENEAMQKLFEKRGYLKGKTWFYYSKKI